ncbi:cyclodeaminase/cyclohydrolase family protein [Pseudonocardia humida]|uniref:Cyclodeaminase/cyclohydrolase family protein n=1 Tax=Pseudonocardia humida TaxID=2800819 RepID=A0ABT1A2V5_9PSEU|nr:cyclodeaminase/cyclohydrolase family protein [Pseudonocardia humida]MCO1657330.1 cyclodeaminase/cyclohydrolase family protein [Pseudonocardia humida]
MDPFGERTVEEFLAAVAARQSAPGGGAVCAVTAAGAAGLAAMSARYSSDEGAAALAGRADAERTAVLALADADAAAYGEVLAALRTPEAEPDRARRVRVALERAADVPLRIAECGARVGEIAVAVAAAGNPNLLGDVRAAVVLAEAAARAAAELVRINVELGGLDAAVAAAARDAVERAAVAARKVARAD